MTTLVSNSKKTCLCYFILGSLYLFSGYSSAASLEGLLLPGPVSAAHTAFENNCEACHSPLSETKQETLCLSCHTDVANDMSARTGLHGKYPLVSQDQCQSCHREHKGLDAQTLEFDLEGFDHKATDFPLHWAHAEAPCASCHLAKPDKQVKYSQAPTQCNACHVDDDPHQGKLGSECASCHNVRQWQPNRFDHSTTAFALTGSHTKSACVDCHTTGVMNEAPTTCVGCHQQQDVHNGSLGSNCQQCHNTNTWTKTSFNHQQHTGFSLTAGHTGLACIACHKPGLPMSSANGNRCISCHAKDDTHQGKNGTQCQSCHTTANWQATTFNHAQNTGFALHGAHSALTCNACHQGALSDPVSTSCNQCHNPDPHAGQLGNNCQQCHNETSWYQDLAFSHELTSFPLLGSHANLECSACHSDAKFHDAEAQCVSCHKQDDVHEQAMGSNCASCHNPASWKVQRFDHAKISGFALIGKHSNLACAACHANKSSLQAQGSDECSTCHQQDDPHQGRFGSDCAQCHTNQSFREIQRF